MVTRTEFWIKQGGNIFSRISGDILKIVYDTFITVVCDFNRLCPYCTCSFVTFVFVLSPYHSLKMRDFDFGHHYLFGDLIRRDYGYTRVTTQLIKA